MLVIYRVQFTCTDLQLDRALRRLAVFPHLAITRIQNGHGEQTCGEMGFLKPLRGQKMGFSMEAIIPHRQIGPGGQGADPVSTANIDFIPSLH